MSAGWTAGDLSRALDPNGNEGDLADALAAASVLALSIRVPDWNDDWEDALALGLRLRDTIDGYV